MLLKEENADCLVAYFYVLFAVLLLEAKNEEFC